ncbi:hypothetical protein COCNU_02G012580 [Cocos nucifera]|uniref:Uncharacterized protein n=1 Tax=Cocos nucifera TaxID=13894 RepID=A0A8K0HZE0_COCNU|nr:hypothetical protein COCNU_02G012580 [Cocos nucifera]
MICIAEQGGKNPIVKLIASNVFLDHISWLLERITRTLAYISWCSLPFTATNQDSTPHLPPFSAYSTF